MNKKGIFKFRNKKEEVKLINFINIYLVLYK